MDNLKRSIIRTSLLCVVVLSVIFAVVLFWLSTLPFGPVRASLDTYTVDGSADGFTEQLFIRIVCGMRCVGLALFLVSAALYIYQKHAQGYTYNLLLSFFSFLADIRRNITDRIKNESRIHLLGFLIIFFSAITVRLFFINQPMRFDEAYTFTNCASYPWYVGLAQYDASNNHIFHTLLMHISYLLFGNKPWVVRLPAFLAGILLVPASYLVSRIFYNKYTALLGSVFIALSPILIAFSTNARGYTLICLFFMLLISLSAYLKKKANAFAWLLFTIISVAGFYTIPIMLYPFGIVVMWMFVSVVIGKRDSQFKRQFVKSLVASSLLAVIFTLILYTPAFIASGFKAVFGYKEILPNSFAYLVLNFPPSIFSTWEQWNRGIPFAISLLLVIGFFSTFIFNRRLTSFGVSITLATSAWLVLVLLVQRIVPYPRVWLFLLPLYFIVASSGVTYLVEIATSKISRLFRNTIWVTGIFVLIFTLYFNIVYTRPILSFGPNPMDNAEEITIFLKDYLKKGDVVIPAVCYGITLLEYYFREYEVSLAHLKPNFYYANRILVIVEDLPGTNLRDVLDKEKIPRTGFDNIKIIRKFSSTILYKMERHNIPVK